MKDSSIKITADIPNKTAKNLGYQFMGGAIKQVVDILFWVVVIVLCFNLLRFYFQLGRDDSDGRGRFNRSGMVVRIDYKTGVEYLESTSGHLTPRLDSDGKPVHSGKDLTKAPKPKKAQPVTGGLTKGDFLDHFQNN